MDVELGAGQRVSLCAVDPSLLGAAGRIDVLTELQRMRSWVDAQEQVLLAAMVEPGDPPRSLVDERVVEKQFVREEVACALKLSPLTVNDRLHVARELTQRLPATLALLAAGEITMQAARVLVDAVTVLPDEVAAAVEGRVLGRAPGQTVANFRACVQRAVLALDPRPRPQRHDAAVQHRRVESRALEDGMGSLYAVLPADDLQAVLAAVQGCADALPAECYPPGPHAADQRRADALVTLTTREDLSTDHLAAAQTEAAPSQAATGGSVPGEGVASVRRRHGRRPGVQVTVALSTLLGLGRRARRAGRARPDPGRPGPAHRRRPIRHLAAAGHRRPRPAAGLRTQRLPAPAGPDR